ncbi:MAG: T9SS type A sorting domain-containing protein [Imperialibacter sp.]|uniref:T9SS type A sorting domain-containing protein n=1 Tax=Imperialibacter sp. TaxID=2038411 RepID=UPI0032F0221C
MKKLAFILVLFSSLSSTYGQVSFYPKDTILLAKAVTPSVPLDWDTDGNTDLVFLKNDALFLMKNFAGDSLGQSQWVDDLPIPTLNRELLGADFDSDGVKDLVYVGNDTEGTKLVILFGGVAGIDSSWLSTPVSFNQIGTIIDMDGDGDLDILRSGTNAVSYVKNLGNRSFETNDSWVPLAHDRNLWSVSFSHLNNNSTADIAIVTSSIGSNSDFAIEIYYDPDGSAGEPDLKLDQFGSNSPRPLFGDLNLDGEMDICDIGNTSMISLINQGATFEIVETTYNHNISDNGILLDVDGDGKLDMLIQTPGSELGYLPGNGDGSFGTMQAIASNIFYGNLSLIDFDSNNTFDIVVDNPFNFLTSVVVLQSGETTLNKRLNSPKAPGLSDFLFEDIDTDGLLDMLVIGGNGGLFIYAGTMDGFSTEATVVEIPLYAAKVNAAKVNEDQIPDLFFTVQTPGNAVSEIQYMQGAGGFSFLKPEPFKHFPNPSRPQVVDLFRDGAPEILQREGYNPFSLYLLSFSDDYDEYKNEPEKVTPSTGNFTDYQLGDFDNDGYEDILMYSHLNTRLMLFRNNQADGFEQEIKIELSDSVLSATVNDFNADGLLDIALVTFSYSNAKVRVYQGDGSFGFTKTFELETNTYIGRILSADMDSNGKVDLLISDYEESQQVLLENLGGNQFQLKRLDLFYNYPQLAFVGSHLLPDIILTSPDNGVVYIGANNSVQEIKSLSSEILSVSVADSSAVFTLNGIEEKERVFLVKEAGAVETTPMDGVFYAHKTSFGLGQKFDDDSYAVYAGADTVIAISGLRPNTNYHLAIYEYASNAPEGDFINYFQAEPILYEFTTDRIHQEISFANNRFFSLADSSFVAEISADSGLPVMLEAVEGPITVDGFVVSFSGAGQASVKASQEGNEAYSPADTVFLVSIDKIYQELVYEEIRDHVVNEDPFEINVVATSGLPVTLELQEGPLTISGSIASATGEGPVTIKAIQEGNENYYAADSLFSFEIIGIFTSVDGTDAEVIVFPNPVEHLMSLRFPSKKYDKGTIYSIDGRRLLETELEHSGDQSLDVSSLTGGVYLLVLTSGKEETAYRFIKN